MNAPPKPWRRHIEPPIERRFFAILSALALLVSVGLYLNGLIGFVQAIPARPSDREAVSDAIVVLTGGSLRVATGFRLLGDKADKLFVSGVHPSVEVQQLLAALPLIDRAREKLECCVTLGHAASDTIGNALETAGWVAATGVKSFRLVTANYHMQRSLLEFRRVMPQLRIIPHPVFSPNFRLEGWWHRPRTASLLLIEYNKLLAARLRHELTDAFFPVSNEKPS